MQLGKAGFVLLFSLFVLSGLSLLLTVNLTRSMTDLLSTNQFIVNQQAFHLAEAGVDEAVQRIKALASPPTWTDPRDPFVDRACDPQTNEPHADPLRPPRSLGTGQYFVCVDPHDDNPTSPINRYTVTVRANTTETQLTRTVTLVVQTESFARFAYFTNEETSEIGTVVWFADGNFVEGPLHTNGQLNISGDPVFDGPVSSVDPAINYRHGGPPRDNPDFRHGLILGADPIPMSSSVLETQLENLKTSSLLLSGDTSVVLDGAWMLVTNTARGWHNHPLAVATASAVFVEGGNLLMQGGLLDGQLTLGSDQDIVVYNSVQYRCDPETLLDGDPTNDDLDCKNLSTGLIEYNDDLLGFVAVDHVMISKLAPNDLAIQASILAIDGSFVVEDYNVGGPRGTLHVFGGIIQNFRGPVGTFNPSNGARLTGYEKHYHYDTRLLTLSPPFYPTTGRYQPVIWRDE